MLDYGCKDSSLVPRPPHWRDSCLLFFSASCIVELTLTIDNLCCLTLTSFLWSCSSICSSAFTTIATITMLNLVSSVNLQFELFLSTQTFQHKTLHVAVGAYYEAACWWWIYTTTTIHIYIVCICLCGAHSGSPQLVVHGPPGLSTATVHGPPTDTVYAPITVCPHLP